MRSATQDALRDSLMNRTVLVIDDSEAVRTAFEVLLSIHGVRTHTAASPAEGLAVTKSGSHQCAVSGRIRAARNDRATSMYLPAVFTGVGDGAVESEIDSVLGVESATMLAGCRRP